MSNSAKSKTDSERILQSSVNGAAAILAIGVLFAAMASALDDLEDPGSSESDSSDITK